ncbi:MAG: diguanylate cyclase [Deltaproteobacteria bacterium]
MSQSTRISIVSSDAQLVSYLGLRLQSKGYKVASSFCFDSVLGVFYSDPPDLLIIDLSSNKYDGVKIISALRSDSFFSAIPIIGLVSEFDCDTFQWEDCPLDDFVHLPINFSELFGRIALSQARIKRIFDNNPLTRLPGNTSIQHAIEDAMGKPLMVCYLDINYFKPYNDAFGFAHGDEVLRMTARIMFNAVHDSGGGFCGHIGGDDFVFILCSEKAEAVCRTIIGHFDVIVLDMFDEETKKRGFYPGTNRKGEKEEVPLLSISIAVVPMDMPKLQHAAKVAEVAAELKKKAKTFGGSRYVVDQRNT